MAKGNFAGGDGSVNNPFLVEDVWDFNKIRIAPAASYKLVNSINFAEPPFDRGFMPILNFTGQLDGGGFQLSNLTISKSGDNVGLFGSSSFTVGSYTAATAPFVKNLVVTNANVSGGSNVGVLFGSLTIACGVGVSNFWTMIRNVYVSGVVNGKTNVGSLVGLLTISSSGYAQTLTDGVHVNTTLTAGSTGTVSGLVGYTSYSGGVFGFANTLVDVQATGGSGDPASFCLNNQVSMKLGMTAVYFNSDAWTLGVQSPNILARTVRQMTTIDGFDALLLAVTESGASAFRLRYGVRPELAIRKSGATFVRVNGDLLDYDETSGKFVKVISGHQPFRTIIQQGGVDLKSLPASAIAGLRTQFGDVVELVQIVDKSSVVNVIKTTAAMDRDAAHDYGERVCFKTTIEFGDDVLGVHHG